MANIRQQRLHPPPLQFSIPPTADRRELQRLLTEIFGYPVNMDQYEELVTDPDIWDMDRVAAEAGVEKNTVGIWRMNGGRQGGAGPVALPPEDGMAGQSPWWYAGGIRKHLMERGVMRPDGRPNRPLRPGRPPDQRTAA